MKKIGFIPIIVKPKEPGSDYVISVIKRRHSRRFGLWVNIVLLIATLISTIYVGEQLYVGYFGITTFSYSLYFYGFLYFSLPLLFILGSHELGHYFVAKRNGVAASLPFFIPAPTILGTLGAFISLRDPLPDRKTLIKVGAAGPLVGFVMSIVVGIIGTYLGTVQQPANVTSSQVSYLISLPIIYYILPAIQTINVHPVAFAAWVGFLVTAINLFPIGQLDGGHIARGLLGNNAKYFSYAFIIILIVLGIYDLSWILFAAIIIILGLSHPPPLNDVSKPGKKEMTVGVVAIILVLLCFSPQPISQHISPNNATASLSLGNDFVLQNNSAFSQNLSSDSYILTLNNSNSYPISVTEKVDAPPGLYFSPSVNINLSASEVRVLPIHMWTSGNTPLGPYNFSVKVSENQKSISFSREVTVMSIDQNLTGNNTNPYYTSTQNFSIRVKNIGSDQEFYVYKFNFSSVFTISASTFSSSGSSTLLSMSANSVTTINVTFWNPKIAAGVVLCNSNYEGMLIFYSPSLAQAIHLLNER